MSVVQSRAPYSLLERQFLCNGFFNVRMRLLHVLDQVAFSVERLLAVIALIVLDAEMNSFEVGLEIVLVRRFKIAHVTVVRFEAEMIFLVAV